MHSSACVADSAGRAALGLPRLPGPGRRRGRLAGVATGIGFLGAGTILKGDRDVQGITTAAGIWVVGAIGAACGAGSYTIAVTATAISIIVLFVLGRFEGDRDGVEGN